MRDLLVSLRADLSGTLVVAEITGIGDPSVLVHVRLHVGLGVQLLL